MPKVQFDKDFTWAPKRGVRIAYKAGTVMSVPQKCVDAAVEAGAVSPVSVKAEKSDNRG